MSLNLPFGIQVLNPVPTDYYYGPWANVAAAKAAIPLGVRYDGLTVQITGVGNYYWTAADLTDSGLIPKFSSFALTNGSGTTAAGTAVNWGGTLTGATTITQGTNAISFNSTLTTGSPVAITNNSTVSGLIQTLYIGTSGANSGQTNYGLVSSNSRTGSGTNVGLYGTSSGSAGSTTNIGVYGSSPSTGGLNIGGRFIGSGGSNNLSLDLTGAIRLNKGSFYTQIDAGTQAANLTYTLPTAYPSANSYVLSATTAGVMSWIPSSAFTLTDGNATTANGTSVDLGGFIVGDIFIDDDGGGHGLFIGTGVVLTTIDFRATNIDIGNAGGGFIQLHSGDNLVIYNSSTGAGIDINADGTLHFESITGAIQFISNSVQRLKIDEDGTWLLGIGEDSGTAGQALTSNGAGAEPTWETPASAVNIYNSNGTLTGNRTLDTGGFNFNISGVSDGGLNGSWYIDNLSIYGYNSGSLFRINQGASTSDGYFDLRVNNYYNGFTAGYDGSKRGFGIYTGTSAANQRLFIQDNGSWLVDASTGTSGQVLTSVGAGSTPIWQTLPPSILRTINYTANSNLTAGGTALTDYIYMCTGTFDITLPTAVGSTSIYYIKNQGVGVVTVKTTGGQTIEGSATLALSAGQAMTIFSNNSNYFQMQPLSGGSGITVGTTTITSGTSTRIPFNDGGVYGEDSALTWDKTNNVLTVSGQRITAVSSSLYFGGGTTSSTGLANTGIGFSSLFSLTSGVGNTAIGSSVLAGLLTGNNNTGIGSTALSNVTGSGNIGVGYAAGDNITSGSNNLIVGFDIDAQSATTSNQLSIQNAIFGVSNSGTGTTISNGNIGFWSNTWGTNAAKVLSIVNGTAPTTAITDGIQWYSVDSSDSTATLGLYLEQAVEAIGTFTPSHKIKVQINGTFYWLQLDAV